MSKIRLAIIIGVTFALGVGAGFLGILYTFGWDATPSRETGEVVSTLSLTPQIGDQVATQLAQVSVDISLLSTEVAGLSGGDVVQTDSSDNNIAEATEVVIPEVARAIFRITEEESEARFKIDETLVGNATVVVGTTNRVAGDILVDFANPSASQMGDIAVNARTLRTDTSLRDQSIRGQILQSSQDEYEFIIFTPIQLAGLPTAPVSIGDSIDFQIVGNLTIRGVTREVTFDANVTLMSSDRIEGFVSTQVAYADFDITINPPPTVSHIGDIVTLELDFVAVIVEE